MNEDQLRKVEEIRKKFRDIQQDELINEIKSLKEAVLSQNQRITIKTDVSGLEKEIKELNKNIKEILKGTNGN